MAGGEQINPVANEFVIFRGDRARRASIARLIWIVQMTYFILVYGKVKP